MYKESTKAKIAKVRLKTLAIFFDSKTGTAEKFAINPIKPKKIERRKYLLSRMFVRNLPIIMRK